MFILRALYRIIWAIITWPFAIPFVVFKYFETRRLCGKQFTNRMYRDMLSLGWQNEKNYIQTGIRFW